jgi:hypothetical protein
VLDEVLLVLSEFLPVLKILREVDLFGCPECGLLILVHLPDVAVFDREEHKAVGVFFEKWLGEGSLSLRVVLRLGSLRDLKCCWVLFFNLRGRHLRVFLLVRCLALEDDWGLLRESHVLHRLLRGVLRVMLSLREDLGYFLLVMVHLILSARIQIIIIICLTDRPFIYTLYAYILYFQY